VSYEGEVCGEEGSFPIAHAGAETPVYWAINENFFAAHVLYSQCHANCDQSSVMARNDSTNEIAVSSMFDQDLLCLLKSEARAGCIIPAMPVQRSWKPWQALFDRYLGRVKVQGCAVISRLRFEDLDPQVQGLIVPLHVSNEVVAQFVLVSVAEYLSAESL